MKIITPIILVILLLGAPSAEARGRRYKRYLDANRAEEILAGIFLKERMYDDEWLQILGLEKKGATYTVSRGDNLWNISRKVVAEPRYWRKLWQMNPYLSNPHELEVGQILQLYNERGDDSAIRIPLVKLMPGGLTDLDNDSFANIDIKNRFQPKLMVVSDEEVVGEITGGYTEKEAFGELDEFYLYFYDRSAVKTGDQFTVVRYERSLADNTQPGAPTIGNLARLHGEVKITAVGEELFRAEINRMFNPIRRGDKLVALKPAIARSAVIKPPDELETRVVMGEEMERRAFGQGEMLLLNKGNSDGMRLGYFFRVYRDQDLFTKKRRDVEPSYKAEVQIVHVGELSSVGFVTRSTDPIYIGDTLVPGQSFPEPVTGLGNNKELIEIP